MKTVLCFILCGMLASAACAQPAQPVRPAVPPASAAEPMTAASQLVPTRSAAITAAENAKEPGVQRPEERVIPQVSIPIKPRKGTLAVAASAPAGSLPGGVNEGVARCMAAGTAAEKAACERGLAASGPVQPAR